MTEPNTLVLGVGNVLLTDEGVGVHVVTRLSRLLADVPGLTVMDGGTLGLELLGPIEEAEQLIVVDCMRAGEAAGSVTVLLDRAATEWTTGQVTAHDLGLPSIFALAGLRGWQPSRVAVVGVEPERMNTGLSLTSSVECGAQEAVATVLNILCKWGVVPKDALDRLNDRRSGSSTEPLLGDR